MLTRKFLLGSEWLYIKIYSGAKTSDLILQESIIPLISSLQDEKLIEKWFFIRYSDPKPHIRLRFLLKNSNYYGIILKKINLQFQEFMDSGEIVNCLIDSYIRELERYGKNTIEYAESLFCSSSELVLNFLEYNDEEKIIASVYYLNEFLSKLKIPDTMKAEWIRSLDSTFKEEFNGDKHLNKQLSKKFAEFRWKYEEFISTDVFKEIRYLIATNLIEAEPLLDNILLLKQEDSLSVSLYDFFKSIFHMHINRTFCSNQRLFEMIIYDYLFRYHKSRIPVSE